jgi:hypothetical protein
MYVNVHLNRVKDAINRRGCTKLSFTSETIHTPQILFPTKTNFGT